MENWLSQRYLRDAERIGIDADAAKHAIATAGKIRSINPRAPILLSLKHLALRSGVSYEFLRSVVERRERHFYRTFRIRKRPLEGRIRYRIIAAPVDPLMRAQRWIAQRVLPAGVPHAASMAYAEDCSPFKAASAHCSARWLIKIDVMNFFESISEATAYRVFRKLGYQPLLSFEMGRICTRVKQSYRSMPRYWFTDATKWSSIHTYQFFRQGLLPQGAPTSPMLSNLAALELDEVISAIAARYKLIYTRYADDMCFSTAGEFSRSQCGHLITDVYASLRRFGLTPQKMKTVVSPPGARKVVLGLLVDTHQPKLTREFKARLRQHLHFLLHPDVGPSLHAARRGFASVIGLRHHVEGLVNYASSVEPGYGDRCQAQLKRVHWPF